MKSKKLLVVDDHPVVLEGLKAVLSAEGYQVLAAGSFKETLTLAEENGDIGLLVVDLTLRRDADGLDLIKDIRSLRPGIPAVVYTMHEEMWNINMLIDADVEGVVLKGEKIEELLEAVRLVGKGAIYRSPEFCGRFDSVRKARGILSQTDLDVLRLISQGLATGEISQKINLTEKSVEYHRSNIIKKLGTKNMTEAIRNAVKLGIITCLAGFSTFVSNAADSDPVPVDLGLSVQWADRNLGASDPHAAGGYYAFGETETKDNYNWSTYLYCKDGDMFVQDNIGDDSICGTEYDAATYALGSDWRMPTLEEMEEFLRLCSWETFPDDEIGYTRFTFSNGTYIDIPLAGQMSLGRVVALNKEASIWTGSFYVEEGEEDGFVYRMNCPCVFGFNDRLDPRIVEGSVQLGLQIRPVYVGTSGVETLPDSGLADKAVYTIDGRRINAPAAPGLYIINGKKHLIH